MGIKMAKKTFAAGMTNSGILNNNGGDKLKEVQAKSEYNFQYIDKMKIISNPKNEKYSPLFNVKSSGNSYENNVPI